MTAKNEDVSAEALLNYIQTSLLGGKQITADENLLLSGLVDSLGVMSLVLFIETSLDKPIPMEDVILENFASVDAIVAYLENQS